MTCECLEGDQGDSEVALLPACLSAHLTSSDRQEVNHRVHQWGPNLTFCSHNWAPHPTLLQNREAPLLMFWTQKCRILRMSETGTCFAYNSRHQAKTELEIRPLGGAFPRWGEPSPWPPGGGNVGVCHMASHKTVFVVLLSLSATPPAFWHSKWPLVPETW